MRLDHVPLVKHVADVLSAVADEVVVSIARGSLRAYSDVLGDQFLFVEDHEQGIGPLEGLVQGLTTARGNYVLVSPCDTPFLKREVCEAIVEAAKGKDGAVPRTGREYVEPLHGAYRRRTACEAFKQVLSTGDRAPTQAFRNLNLVFIDEGAMRALDPELVSFWNINSPSDLRKAEDHLARLR